MRYKQRKIDLQKNMKKNFCEEYHFFRYTASSGNIKDSDYCDNTNISDNDKDRVSDNDNNHNIKVI